MSSSSITQNCIDFKNKDAIELVAFFRTYCGLQRQIGGLIALFMPNISGEAVQVNRPGGGSPHMFKFGVGTVFDTGSSPKTFYDQAAAHIVDSVLQGKLLCPQRK